MAVAIKTYDYGKWPLFMQAKRQIRHGGTVVDVGAGIRPQRLVVADKHICIEPHKEYADALESAGYSVVRKTAFDALSEMGAVDTVIALDVIEHMPKDHGRAFIDAAKLVARQVIIFTPLGFMPQEQDGDVDAWGLNGQKWQVHQSGWMPSDFDGWKILIDNDFHKSRKFGAFFAITGGV